MFALLREPVQLYVGLSHMSYDCTQLVLNLTALPDPRTGNGFTLPKVFPRYGDARTECLHRAYNTFSTWSGDNNVGAMGCLLVLLGSLPAPSSLPE